MPLSAASEKSMSAPPAAVKSVSERRAREKRAWSRQAHWKSALETLARSKLAPRRSAPEKSVSSMVAPFEDGFTEIRVVKIGADKTRPTEVGVAQVDLVEHLVVVVTVQDPGAQVGIGEV